MEKPVCRPNPGSYRQASARERLARLMDAGSFVEFLPPPARTTSPHLAQLGLPAAPDDGVAVGRARLSGMNVFTAAQDGDFLGGAVGEVHGAKLVGLLRRAVLDKPDAVVLLLDSGGVRLQEANAGLVAVAEVLRAVLDVRAAGIPVIALAGGANGCFGGVGIVARCANALAMSDEARLGMSGPGVIESVNGVDEFDSRDRALVLRTTGGKHRYLLGDCEALVPDSIAAFRQAAIGMIDACREQSVELTMTALEQEQWLLAARIDRFGDCADPTDTWRALGIDDPAAVPTLDTEAFVELAAARRVRAS
jgi:malonate decarboxylase beta subunit